MLKVKKQVKAKPAKAKVETSKKEERKFIDSLDKIYIKNLNEIYDVEIRMKEWIESINTSTYYSQLRKLINDHIKETKVHIQRLDEIFKGLGIKPHPEKSEPVEKLINEGIDVIQTYRSSYIRDAFIISVLQRIEHYEIACYGTLLTFANTLEYSEAAKNLYKTLMEEKETDSILNQIAKESYIRSEEESK